MIISIVSICFTQWCSLPGTTPLNVSLKTLIFFFKRGRTKRPLGLTKMYECAQIDRPLCFCKKWMKSLNSLKWKTQTTPTFTAYRIPTTDQPLMISSFSARLPFNCQYSKKLCLPSSINVLLPMKTYSFLKQGSQRWVKWENTNKLLKRGFQGIKTGNTAEAGPCLASVLKSK